MKKMVLLIHLVTLFSWSLFGAEPSTPPLKGGGIVYEVHAEPSYEDAEKVDFDCRLVNHSTNAMTMSLDGLARIKLIGPDGQPVRPYPYHPSGRRGPSYLVECFPPGARREWEMRLSAFFPFPLAGEYRCLLTRRVYQLDSPEVVDSDVLLDRDYYGKPVDVTASELRFRVEKPTLPDRPRQAVAPLNHIGEPGLEYDTMPTKEYPARGEGSFRIRKTQSHGVWLFAAVAAFISVLWAWYEMGRRKRHQCTTG
jgi:hypothetical protein